MIRKKSGGVSRDGVDSSVLFFGLFGRLQAQLKTPFGSQDVACTVEEIEQTLTCFSFPKDYRKRIRTTNGLERFREEIKRRSRVARIFPNDASCLRLIGALSMEQSEECLTSRRYLDMSTLEASNSTPGLDPRCRLTNGPSSDRRFFRKLRT